MPLQNEQIAWTLSAIDKASGVFKGVESGMKGMEAAWARVEQVIVGGVAAEAIAKIVEHTKEAEQANNRLAAVLRNTGAAAGYTKDQLEEMATALSHSTQFDDEDIKKASAEILIFGKIHGQTFRDALKLSADVAAFWGSDLQDAAKNVAKALSEPETAFRLLKNAGVILSEQQKDQIKHMGALGDTMGQQKLVLDLLKRAYAGVSDEMNTGFTKATRDAYKAWDDLLKALGKTSVVKNTTVVAFEGIALALKHIKETIEAGDWIDKLKLLGLLTPYGWAAMAMSAPSSARPHGATGSWGGNVGATGSWGPGGAEGLTSGMSDADYAAMKLRRATAAGFAEIGLGMNRDAVAQELKLLDDLHHDGYVSEEKYYDDRSALIKRKLEDELDAIKKQITTQAYIERTAGTKEEISAATLAIGKLNASAEKARSDAATEQVLLASQKRRAAEALNIELGKHEIAHLAELDAALKKQVDIRYSAAEADRDYLDEMRFEFELIGKTATEQQKMNELRRIDLKLRADLRKAAEDAGDNNALYDSSRENLVAGAEKQKQIVIDSVSARIKVEREWSTGARSIFMEYADHASNAAEQARDFFTHSFQSMEDALVSFATSGKLNFNSLANSIISDLARIAIRQNITGPLAQGLSGGGFGGLFGGIFGQGGGGGMVLGDAGATGGYIPMAAGGDFLVTKPTLFLAGEAGPERATFSGAGKLGGGHTFQYIDNSGRLSVAEIERNAAAFVKVLKAQARNFIT